MKSSHKTIALWLSLFLVAALLIQAFGTGARPKRTIKYNELVQFLDQGKIKEATFKKDENLIVGLFKDSAQSETESFETIADISNPKIYEEFEKRGVIPNYAESEKTPVWQQVLISWFPMLLLILFFFLFMRQLQVGGGKAMSFGKSKARLLNESNRRVTFKDVAGVEEAKEELEEIIQFLKDPKKFTKLGGRIPKGVLLMGPPGTGKTLLAKAVAGEAGVPFFSISGSDFVEMFVGVGASRVRDLFEQGKKHAPCIVFIDEIDAVGRHRGAGLGGGHDEREQTLNQLLVEMDGFESNDGVILMAATNRPDVLDPALLRPGRFDRRVTVSNPDIRGREQILNVHTRKVPLEENVRLKTIAQGTPGFSGADLENLVNEAALIAARKDQFKITIHDLEEAKDKVMMGAERRSMVISDDDKRVTAYHEAGHTLVGFLLSKTDPIHKVTIIPRGRALGITHTLPDQDRLNMDKERAEQLISFLMGGRLAEDKVMNLITSGAGNDIERATDIARRMVCEWGMTDALGPLAYGQKEGEVFLGREISRNREMSEETARSIDREIRSIIDKNYKIAEDLVVNNLDRLHALAKALLEFETIDGAEVAKIMAGEKITRKTHTESGGTASKSQLNFEEDAGANENSKDKKSGAGSTSTPAAAPA